MNPMTQALQEWAIKKIKEEYAEDVAILVAVSGASVNDDGHGECFDYYIPTTERGYSLAQTFIIDGIGHDLYPRSWKRMEETAMLDDGPTICLANAKIIYSRTTEDAERFIKLQQQLQANLYNENYMYERGLEQIDLAMNLYSTLLFQEEFYKARMIAGYIAKYLANAVAYLNGTYLNTYNKVELQILTKLPNQFIGYYETIMQGKTKEELRENSNQMIHCVRQFYESTKCHEKKQKSKPDYAGLADWYQELSLIFRRIRYFCDVQEEGNVYIDACYLQNELEIVQEEFGLQEMDLMGYYDHECLDKIKERSSQIEQSIIDEIQSHGIRINQYDTLEEFLLKN